MTSLSGAHFSLSLVSPVLVPGSNYQGLLSFRADGEIEIIEAFPVRVAQGASNDSPSSYVSNLNGASGDLTLSGAGSVSITRNGQTLTIFGSAPTGDYYPASNPSGFIAASALAPYATQAALVAASGALASNVPSGVVHTTGNESINGVKTFTSSGVFNGGVKTQFLYDSNSAQAIDLSNHTIKNGSVAPWKIDSDYIAIEPWSTYSLLTKIVPADPGSPSQSAFLNFYDVDFDNVSDGQSFTVSYNGTTYTFEWDNDSSHSVEGSRFVTIGGSRSESITNFVSTIQSAFPGSFFVTTDDGNALTFSTSAGSFYSCAFSGSIGFTSYDQSSTGTDGTSGTPESGTRLVTLKNAVSNRVIKAIMISIVVRDADWANTGIEIGYWNGEAFIQLCQIPQGALSVGIHHLFQQISFPTEAALGLYYSGYNYNLIARSGQDGTPADETSGGDAYIYVKGVYSAS